MTDDIIGYEWYYLYWPDEKVKFRVDRHLKENYYICVPTDDDPEVTEVCLHVSEIRSAQNLDKIFGTKAIPVIGE